MKNKKVLLIMLGIAVLLSAAYAAVIFTSKDEEDSTKNYVVPLDSPGNVSAMEVEYGGEKYKLVLGEEWYLEEDENFPVDQSTALAMANGLYSVFADRETEAAGDDSEYGLDEPQCIIRAWDEDGCEFEYAIGAYNDYAEMYYLKADDRLYLADSTLPELFFTSRQDMIEIERLPDIYDDEVTKIVITRAGVSTELENNDETAEAVASFTGLYFYDCAAYNVKGDELAAYGLSEPEAEVALYYTKTETISTGTVDDEGSEVSEKAEVEYDITLLFGADTGDGYTYVMVKDSDRVYTASMSECDIITSLE